MTTDQQTENLAHGRPLGSTQGVAINLSELFCPANLITLSRIALLPFIVIFLARGYRVTALAFMVLLLLTDALDGYVARRLNQVSDMGKFLDPLCDKIALAVILITLYAIGSLPLWGVIIIIFRDVLILIGSFVLIKARSRLYKSNTIGKLTGFLFGLILCAFTLNLTDIGTILLYICIPALIVSFTVYLLRYMQAMKGVK
jgi:CDP-diacylglycerol--glycerol-3-phosphate 3-phosphatidyltransferase